MHKTKQGLTEAEALSEVQTPICASRMNSDLCWQTIDTLFKASMLCRVCFDQHWAEPALIDVAQPRLIAPAYFSAAVAVMVVSLNPGAGNTPEKREDNRLFRQVLHDYKEGRKGLRDLFAFQRQSIPQWGWPRGRFVRFYIDGMGLTLDEIALANIGWCADGRNKWPKRMLSHCFQHHTRSLLQIVCPKVVILSGSGTHHYATEIQRVLPNCSVVQTLHYAHRKGREKERAELLRVRNQIAACSTQ